MMSLAGTPGQAVPQQALYSSCHLPEIVEEFYKALKPAISMDALAQPGPAVRPAIADRPTR